MSSSSVKVSNCDSAKKFAIVNEVGDFYIIHHDTNDEAPSSKGWNRPGSAPVAMAELVGDNDRRAKRKMLQLKVLGAICYVSCSCELMMADMQAIARVAERNSAKKVRLLPRSESQQLRRLRTNATEGSSKGRR